MNKIVAQLQGAASNHTTVSMMSMSLRGVLIAMVSAAFTATGSSAADIAVGAHAKASVVATTPAWTSWYGGVNLGGGWSKTDAGYSANDPLTALLFTAVQLPTNPDRVNPSGALGGFQLGYNSQFAKNWLAGLETDFQFSGIRGSSGTAFFGGLIATKVSQNIEYFGTVRARLGYLPTDRLLVYATGGFAYAKLNNAASLSVVGSNINGNLPVGGTVYSVNCGNGDPDTCFVASSNRVSPGWTAGGGLEYSFWQNWSVKGEYLFARFEETLKPAAITVIAAPGAVASTYNARVTTDLNVVRLGLNYRFSGN